MQTQMAQDFSHQIDASSELQARIRAMTSVGELMALANELGFQLSGEDLQSLAQQAYQQWLAKLSPRTRPFFEHLHDNEAANNQHQACRSPEDVIALATQHGFELTLADLQQAARASVQEGFSFEKLWFQNLGLL